jgi:hypothetical protein
MAEAGGLDLSQFQKPKEQPVKVEQPKKFVWMPQYKMMWERTR